MIKNFLIISLWVTMLTGLSIAKVSYVDYKATFGIFGTVGTIKNKITQNNKRYKIETTVSLAGIAKMIMGGQTEHYVSTGHIINGLMISDTYTMKSIKKNEKKLKEYVLDHAYKHITKRYQKWENGKRLRDETQVLKFYAKNDLLTLYFNMNKAITKKGKIYHFKAVGLEKQKGKVTVTVPTDGQSKKYKIDLGETANWYAKARIVQENFRNNSGDILLSVGKDGFIKKAVIKDILMYGDAVLERVK